MAKKILAPRCKRMKRQERLQAAKIWLSSYNGKNLVQGYKNHFAVDEVCALIELKMLGQPIDEASIDLARKSAQRRAEAKASRRQSQPESFNPYPDSDDSHSYIAGYTANGFPYGITWEHVEADGLSAHEAKPESVKPERHD